MPLVVVRAGVNENLELCVVQGHQTEVETREQSGETEEDHADTNHQPER